MSVWQVQSAKQRFSEVLRQAERGEPQFITRNGREVAVIIDVSDYRSTHGSERSLWDRMEAIPRTDGDIGLMELIGPREIDNSRRWFEQDEEVGDSR